MLDSYKKPFLQGEIFNVNHNHQSPLVPIWMRGLLLDISKGISLCSIEYIFRGVWG